MCGFGTDAHKPGTTAAELAVVATFITVMPAN